MILDNFQWVEKYRPTKISDIILPASLKKKAMTMIKGKNISNMILSGSFGVGKTTLAKAFAAEVGADLKIYNGSDGSLNLEELRENIADYANVVSLNNNGTHKIILIDEADGLSAAIQKALNNAIEKYHNNCRFILTANYPEKILGSIHSRCAHVQFKFTREEQTGLLQEFARKTAEILKAEGVPYEIEPLKAVIMKFYPDNRKILNELQFYANEAGKIDNGLLENLEMNLKVLFDALNVNDFAGTKQWLHDHCTPTIFNTLFKECERHLPEAKIPYFIMRCGEAQKYHGIVPSPELNALAALTEYMADVA